MSNFLGFQPTTASPYYFISYGSDDAARIGPIVCALSQKLPLWYDYGLAYGEDWKKNIADHIENAEGVLLFLSKNVLAKGNDSYVYTEYQMARDFFNKSIIIIQVESITKSDIPNELLGWWIELNRYQRIIQYSSTTEESLADSIYQAVRKSEKTGSDVSYVTHVPNDSPMQPVKDPTNTETPLLKRASIYLEDGEWQRADEYYERVLDLNPENYEAYLGKLMVEQHVCRQEDLQNCDQPFDHSLNYINAVRFGNERLASELQNYIVHINEQNEKRIFVLAAVLKMGLTGTIGETFEEKKTDAKKTIEALTVLLNGFDELLIEASLLKNELSRIELQKTNLNEQRAKLGVFALQDRKHINAEISALETKKQNSMDQLNQNRQKRLYFESKEAVERAITLEKTIINDLEARIKNEHNSIYNSYSFMDAVTLYSQNSGMASVINAILPIASICSSTPTFGRYVQRENGTPEPIEWIPLKRETGRMLLISKYVLDCQQYNNKCNTLAWYKSTLRKWLQNSFLPSAFTDDEQAMIQSETLIPEIHPLHLTHLQLMDEKESVDKVFLLSISEAEKYFSSDEVRKCQPTDYATKNTMGQMSPEGRVNYRWWLRSPAYHTGEAAFIKDNGKINLFGLAAFDKTGVRPAIWVKFGF